MLKVLRRLELDFLKKRDIFTIRDDEIWHETGEKRQERAARRMESMCTSCGL